MQHEMRFWGREYPHAGYGGMIRRWLHAENPKPYGSFGNGSAMRVSAAGWLFDTLDKTLEMAKVTTEVTHNHPEGIKGAQATSAAIFLARTGHSKPEIKQYVEQTFGYDLNRTCDEIRPTYQMCIRDSYSDENTCYNIAMAQVSVAQEGKLPEMHERLIILRELLTRAAPSIWVSNRENLCWVRRLTMCFWVPAPMDALRISVHLPPL